MDSEYLQEEDEEVVDAGWYEKNLQLAAELGKALLEKNRELESQLTQQQNISQDQTLEIQFLKSQLETMRTTTDSRNRVYEEVDRTAQELEKNNQKLMMEAKGDRQKIENQALLISQLEDKNDELERKLEDAKAAEKKSKAAKKAPEKRRTSSLNRLSINESKDQGFYFENLAWTFSDQFKNKPLNPYEIEIRKLQDTLQHMKVQQTIERRKMEDLDVECSVLMDENQKMEKKVQVLETNLSEAIIVQCELEELGRRQAEALQGRHSVACHTDNVPAISQDLQLQALLEPGSKLLREIEHDDPELRSEAKAVKLESGGSLYSSTESINKVATDAKEIQVEDPSLSILDELETQYQSLFNKYQAVIQSKGRREGDEERQRQAHKEVQTLLHITLNRDYYQDNQGQIPPYKALFKDIFATLRKTTIEENDGDTAEKRLSAIYSPSEEEKGASGPAVDGR